LKLGHKEFCNVPDELRISADLKNNEVIVGDDPGCHHFASLQARFDFLNLPYLEKIGARLFSSAEIVYYPSCYDKIRSIHDIKDQTRVSFGFGINVPYQMINL